MPDKSVTDEMVEEAALALYHQGILALDGSPAVWERHADGFRGMARAALEAAAEVNASSEERNP